MLRGEIVKKKWKKEINLDPFLSVGLGFCLGVLARVYDGREKPGDIRELLGSVHEALEFDPKLSSEPLLRLFDRVCGADAAGPEGIRVLLREVTEMVRDGEREITWQ